MRTINMIHVTLIYSFIHSFIQLKTIIMGETVQIRVKILSMGANRENDLDDIPVSTTIGELKEKLGLRPNTHCGREGQAENWDNRRTLADYSVRDGDQLACIVQCVVQDGQGSHDDYNEWLQNNQNRNN